MVKLCILQAGEFSPEMDPAIPRYEPLYRSLFAPFDTISLTFYKVRDGVFPESIADHDAFLITGSPAGTYDSHDWIQTLRDLIREIHAARKPLVGICFGHQMIADALGGSSGKSPKGWGLGVRRAAISDAPAWLDDMGSSFDLLYVHQDQVTAVPPDAVVIAGNTFCPIAAFTLGDHIFCMQGHPEFTAEAVEAIIDFRTDRIAADVGSEAKATLHLPHDSQKMGRAIVRFIDHAQRSSLPSA
ncbi:MAG: glutamine amidotransferase-related protein [Candidatus Puniceispirillales bacterium]